jgi:hypothetical protein
MLQSQGQICPMQPKASNLGRGFIDAASTINGFSVVPNNNEQVGELTKAGLLQQNSSFGGNQIVTLYVKVHW